MKEKLNLNANIDGRIFIGMVLYIAMENIVWHLDPKTFQTTWTRWPKYSL